MYIRDAVSQIDSSDGIGIRQRDVESVLFWTQQHRGRMRTRPDGILRLRKVDPSRYLAGLKVKLSNVIAVPQADPSLGPRFVRNHCVRICARNKAAAAQIEPLHDFIGACIEDNGVVGKIIGDEQAVALGAGQHCEPRGIWERSSGGSFAHSERHFFPFGDGLRRNLDEALRSNLSGREFVHRDAVTGILRLLAGRVGDRAH